MSVRSGACLRWCLITAGALFLVMAIALVSVWFSLPSVEPPLTYVPKMSNRVVDRHGVLLYEAMADDTGVCRWIEFEMIPEHLKQAVVATEDASFYTNPGFDVRALLRAAWLNLQSGGVVSGGSTITQQVARNLLMNAEERYEQSLLRKLRELMLSLRLSRRYDKDSILALYLNTTYFGHMTYGVEAASWQYFDRPASQLDLAQCALVAGLAQAPAVYDPLLDPEAARERQGIVLGLMADVGYITAQDVQAASTEELDFASSQGSIKAPHLVFDVLGSASKLYPDATLAGGMVIRTTIDAGLQSTVEEIVEHHLTELNLSSADSSGHNANNAAVVVLSVPDGEILAMVGSPDYCDESISGSVNAATALRQPGSLLKPFTYAAAFEQGYSPASVICDVPVTFVTKDGKLYSPQNYDREFHGPTSLRTALACSYNVVAVCLLDRIGVDSLLEMAARVGFDALQDAGSAGLSLTLGSAEVTLIELVEAYGTLASGGLLVDSRDLLSVSDGTGTELYGAPLTGEQRVLSPAVTSLITDVLADSAARRPAFGANSQLETPFGAAVKTGTSTDFRDNWTVGYTSDYVVGVWVGNADGAAMNQVSGVDGAAPIWHDVMLTVQRDMPQPFVMDSSLVEVDICPDSGKLPSPACSHTVSERFLPENLPTATCEMHRFVEIDAATGLLASEDTPESRVVLRRMTVWPSVAQAWAQERGLDGGWHQVSEGAEQTESLEIVYPAAGAVYCISQDMPRVEQQLRVHVAADSGALVELYCDGELLAIWNHRPCLADWQLVSGMHTFTAKSGQLVDRVSISVMETCTGERIAQ